MTKQLRLLSLLPLLCVSGCTKYFTLTATLPDKYLAKINIRRESREEFIFTIKDKIDLKGKNTTVTYYLDTYNDDSETEYLIVDENNISYVFNTEANEWKEIDTTNTAIAVSETFNSNLLYVNGKKLYRHNKNDMHIKVKGGSTELSIDEDNNNICTYRTSTSKGIHSEEKEMYHLIEFKTKFTDTIPHLDLFNW